MAITFVTSIPALLLYHPVLHDHSYILGPGHGTRIELAALLEVVLAISGIGVAVVMFPILRRESERLALGYVASRIVESTMICVGLVSLLSVLTLRGDLATSVGANAGSLEIAGRTLVAVHRWTFLIGPGFCVAVNDILLGYLMYSTGLMPRRLALLGLIGGPLIFASSTRHTRSRADRSPVRRLRPIQHRGRHPHDPLAGFHPWLSHCPSASAGTMLRRCSASW